MGRKYQRRARMERARNLPDEILVAIGEDNLSHERFDRSLLIEKVNDRMDIEQIKFQKKKSSF